MTVLAWWAVGWLGISVAAPVTASSEVARQLSTAQLRVADVESQLVQTDVQLRQLQEWVLSLIHI